MPTLAARGDTDAACEAAATLMDIFDRRVAIECWDHGLPEERVTTARLIEIARALDVPWVVTNDVHYARARDRMVHDVLSCLRHDRTLDQMGTRLRPNAEWYLKSAAQIARRWRANLDGVRATLAVAERCAFRLDQLDPTLPAFPLPPGVSADEYLARLVEQGARERWGEPGTTQRTAEHEKQIAHELALIAKLGLAGYFLIVWDIVRFARREGILCQGRGSAANSAVCYCLGITAVDPIRLNLLFERFLSEERTEAPDIDIDFAHRERERVLQYVYERYGREHAAMVCEQITYRGKSAVRDAARVLGFCVEQADSLAHAQRPLLGEGHRRGAARDAGGRRGERRRGGERARQRDGARHRGDQRGRAPRRRRRSRCTRPMTSSDRPTPNAAYEPYGSPNAQSAGTRDLARIPTSAARAARRRAIGGRIRTPATITPSAAIPTTALRETGGASVVERAGLDPNDKRVRALAEIVDGLHQLPRHRSIHVGGFVLTAEPLRRSCPIEPASMPGRTVIQWEKDDLDPVGLVKIDLLGLGMLTAAAGLPAVHQTDARRHDRPRARSTWTDQAVYDDLCAADTIGVFQVESRAQMNTLPRLKPRCFYDLVVEVAIIRPGPIQGDMVHPVPPPAERRGAGDVSASVARADPQAHARRAALPGAGDAGGDRARRVLAGRGGRAAPRDGAQAEPRADGGDLPADARRHGEERHRDGRRGPDLQPDQRLRRLRIPREPRGELRAARVRVGVPQALLRARVHGGDPQRAADGVLRAGHAGGGRAAPRRGGAAGGRDALGVGRDAGAARGAEPSVTRGTANGVRIRGASTRTSLSRARRAARPAQRPRARRDGARPARAGARARDRSRRSTTWCGARGSTSAALRHLAEAGAFDALLPQRARRAEAARRALALLDAARGDAGPLAPRRRVAEREHVAPLPPMTRVELTEADYRMTGISLAGHPMAHVRPVLEPNGVRSAADLLRNGRDGERVATAGLVICRQRPGTAKGFVFLTLEDETGLINVVVTPQRFERQALLISRTPLLLVRGVLQVEQKVVNVRAQQFRALQAAVGAEFAKRHDFH